MMGVQKAEAQLFYEFNLESHVPADHLLREIDRFLDMAGMRGRLRPFHSHTGRPSIDPELIVRMLVVGYVMGIRSERRLCQDVHLNLAYRWFCRLGLDDKVPDHSTFSRYRHGKFRESGLLRQIFERRPETGRDRRRRGRTLLFAAEPSGDMIKAPSPASLTPRLSDAETVGHLDAARGAIALAFGVLPGLLNPATTGPMVREAQRHLATWMLQPMADLLAEEASTKLGGTVRIDVHRPLQSFDQGGSARAVAGIMQALATAKEAGLSDAQVAAAFGALDWSEARG